MLQKAAKGLSYLFIAKIFTKFLDFSLNHLIIRNIDKKIFGLTLYFNLLQNTALLWVKLCLKQSYLKRNVKLQSQDKASQEELDQVLVTSAKNMMTIGSYITIAWSAILFLVWNYLYGDLNENFSQATALVCLGAIFESIQDTLIVKALLNFEYGLVATAESIAISTKTILLFLTIYFNVLPPLVCFGFSNAVYGVTLTLASYILNKKNSIGNMKDALTLKKLDNKGIKKAEGAYIHRDMKNTSKEMTLIAFPKFLLQEIEKIILGNINTNEVVNGEYMVISNLGSMIPRYFFAPTEEVCYNLFAKMGQEAKSSDKKEIKISENELSTLRNIFKIINIVGSLVAVFGFSYSSTVLNLLYPNNWDTQSCILGFQLYAIYIYVMGINGVLESFFYSTVNEKYLQRYRYFIVFNTLIFIVASYILGQYGVWGIVTANIISMVVRILNCFYYMRMKMKDVVSLTQFLKSSLPSKVYIAYLVFVLVFTRFSHGILPKLLFRLAEGAVLGLGSLAIIYKFHNQEIKSILAKRKEKSQ